MSSIRSEIIGELIQDNQFEDWWTSLPIKIPFFNNKTIEITFMDFVPESDPQFINDADKALKSFLSKSETDRLLISSFAYKNCMEFLNAVGFDEADQPLWDIKEKLLSQFNGDKKKWWKFWN
jgi:hypothetical protein